MLASSSVPRRASGQTRNIGFLPHRRTSEHFVKMNRATAPRMTKEEMGRCGRRCGLAEAREPDRLPLAAWPRLPRCGVAESLR